MLSWRMAVGGPPAKGRGPEKEKRRPGACRTGGGCYSMQSKRNRRRVRQLHTRYPRKMLKTRYSEVRVKFGEEL